MRCGPMMAPIDNKAMPMPPATNRNRRIGKYWVSTKCDPSTENHGNTKNTAISKHVNFLMRARLCAMRHEGDLSRAGLQIFHRVRAYILGFTAAKGFVMAQHALSAVRAALKAYVDKDRDAIEAIIGRGLSFLQPTRQPAGSRDVFLALLAEQQDNRLVPRKFTRVKMETSRSLCTWAARVNIVSEIAKFIPCATEN